MKRIPEEVMLEVEERSPRFAEVVVRMATQWQDPVDSSAHPADSAVHIRLAAFRGDFALLYQCLWYADFNGVPVLFSPSGERRLR